MLDTATITGIFYGTDGAPVTEADVYIVPKQKTLAAVSGAAWVPRAVTGRTDATGAIGTFNGATFTAGIALGAGQFAVSVRKGDASYNGTLTVDAAMIAAGATALDTALQPAPEPQIVSAAALARDQAVVARDEARDWATTPENVEVTPGQFSSLHHAATSGTNAGIATTQAGVATTKAGEAAASALQAETFAAGSELRGAVGTLSAVVGQIARERVGPVDLNAAFQAAVFAARVAGQVADQVNGGQVALRGGTLADPALRIGSAGIYSSATDTLSVAIAGVEVARFTASGLTIFGTVTEV